MRIKICLRSLGAAVLLCAPPAAFAITWNVTSPSTGQVLVSWSSGRTYAVVQEQPEGSSSWASVGSGNGPGGSVQLTRSNGRYFYRIQDCLVTGGPTGSSTSCSYTPTKTILISTSPPAVPSGFTVPATNTTGSYTISWNSQTGVTHYLVDEQINGGGFSTTSVGGTNKTYSGKVTGVYGYRIRACNAAGCSSYTSTKSVSVNRGSVALGYKYDALGRLIKVEENNSVKVGYCYDAAGNRTFVTENGGGEDCPDPPPPPAPTGLSYTTHSGSGYIVYWNRVSAATYYLVRFGSSTNSITYTVQGGSSTQFATGSNTLGQAPDYMQACNDHGCSVRAYF